MIENNQPEYHFDKDGARHSVWDNYLSIDSLPSTLKNLKEVRDMAILSASHSDDLVWNPDAFMNFQDMITFLEELMEVHLKQESEIARNMLSADQRFMFRYKL